MKKYDYLPMTDIYLYQDPRFLKVNTDTALLGHFYTVNPNERVLDIGTNNGALLLFKKEVKACFYAVEIIDEALGVAIENFEYNQMDVVCESIDIRDYQETPFDVIVCNPPYFRDSNHNASHHLAIQRHDGTLGLDELFKAVARLLKPNGRFYLVHRATYLSDIYQAAAAYKMRPLTIQFIHDENKSTARSVLMEMTKREQAETTVLNPHWIKR